MPLHPYSSLESFQFWSRGVTWVAPGNIDPVSSSFRLQKSDKIVTLGSCFAQHISKHLSIAGFNYWITERQPEGSSHEEALIRNFGVFSARYGNVYTVRQALQLFDRAFGLFSPRVNYWKLGSRYVDPFRPQIEPNGFVSPDSAQQSREIHLGAVRHLFRQADCIVFTLGLTEAWVDSRDGAVFPLAPGVHGGAYDSSDTAFVNFTIDQVRNDLFQFIERVQNVNPTCRFILTVSPVPLIATYERQHVLVSTIYSKSVLRVAADEAKCRYKGVIYFPSYEIITSPAAQGRYYADDLRQVTQCGVQHVMKIFRRHFLEDPRRRSNIEDGQKLTHILEKSMIRSEEIICDEVIIENSLRDSGF